MATKSIKLPKHSELQIYYPKLSHNGFGYGLIFKTGIVLGKTAFALMFFGFGVGYCYNVPKTLYGVQDKQINN